MTDPRHEKFRQWLEYTDGIAVALTTLLTAASTLRAVTDESRRILEPASQPTAGSHEMAAALEANERLRQRLLEAVLEIREAYNELDRATAGGP